MDTTCIQIHITGQEKIFLLIWIRDYKWQPLTAHLWTGETESPTWASTTSILHLMIASSLEKGNLGRTQKCSKGQRDADSSIKFWQQWTIVSMLSTFSYAFNVPRGSLYSSSKGYWRVESVRSQGIWKARSHMSRIQVKEQSKRIWIYAHIPMYATIEGISAYVRGYRGKSRVYQYYNVFWGWLR